MADKPQFQGARLAIQLQLTVTQQARRTHTCAIPTATASPLVVISTTSSSSSMPAQQPSQR